MKSIHSLNWTIRVRTLLFLALCVSSQVFAQTVKIMPLGNSITQGVMNITPDPVNDQGYRKILADLLDAESFSYDLVGTEASGVGFDNNHEGHPGWRADEIINGRTVNDKLSNWLQSEDPDVVLVHIGTNDISEPQTAESTAGEIEQIIDLIGKQRTIVLSSLVPRTDALDGESDNLNSLIAELYKSKRDDEGYDIFYLGANELFKSNPNWQNDYYNAGDDVHPNQAAYALLGEAVYAVFKTSVTTGSNNLITDTFERANLSAIWDAHPDYIIENGELKNTAPTETGRWKQMAVYRGAKNSTTVEIKWSETADVGGIDNGGVVFVNEGSRTADGYLAWITASDNNIRLWEVRNGEAFTDLLATNPISSVTPTANSRLSVDLSKNGNQLTFNFYVDDAPAGSASTTDTPGYLNSDWYAGILTNDSFSNNIEHFFVDKASDTTPPGAITNLSVDDVSATSVKLIWTATGDDGNQGQASSYDLRYSNSPIDNDNDFNNATQVTGEPVPAVSGTPETFTVGGLSPNQTYYFSIKAIDNSGGRSPLGPDAVATTTAGNVFVQDFSAASQLTQNWEYAPGYQITSGRLEYVGGGSWTVDAPGAILKARKNPSEMTLTWAAAPDANQDGMDQGGFLVLFSSQHTGNGYAITKRKPTSANQVRLWRISNGNIAGGTIDQFDSPFGLDPGDKLRVEMYTDGSSNFFQVYANGAAEGELLVDSAPTTLLSSDYYGGVLLNGGLNNDIEHFEMLVLQGPPSQLVKVTSTDNQVGIVGKPLDNKLQAIVTDDGGAPVSGVNVNWQILSGGGSLDVAEASNDIVIEAESGAVKSPLSVESDPNASNGKYVTPTGTDVDGDWLTLNVYIPVGGGFHIWGRVIAKDNNSNAFKVVVDGDTSRWDVGQFDDYYNNWGWDQISDRGNAGFGNVETDPVVFVLSTGAHTIKIVSGKVGTKLDQLVITPTNSGFTPPADNSPVIPGGTVSGPDGVVQTTLTLGTSTGVTSSVRAYFGTAEVTFNAIHSPDVPNTIEVVSGNAQTGERGQALANPFVVLLKDQYGNLAEGVNTTWTVTTGDGTMQKPNPVLADLNGQASNTLTLSQTAPLNEVSVTATGYTGIPPVFTATPMAGAADKLVNVSSQAEKTQTGSANTPLALPFKAQVQDASNVPVPNHPVTFTATAGTFSNGQSSITVNTAANGTAEVILTLGVQFGATHTVTATGNKANGSPLTGSGTVTYSATSAIPTTLERISELNYNGTVTLPVSDSIAVRVIDSLGKPAIGATVKFEITQGGGKVDGVAGPKNVPTNALGIAKVEWQLGPQEGTNNNKLTVSASHNNTQYGSFVFTASAVGGAAGRLAYVSGNEQMKLIGELLDAPFVARVTDNSGNPVAGWIVTFTVTDGDGTIDGKSSVTKQTDANGDASARLRLGTEAATPENQWNYKVMASALNVTELEGSPIEFRASGITTGASRLILVDGGGQTGPASLPLTKAIVAKVVDDAGNGIPQHPVAFEVTQGGGTVNGSTNSSISVNTGNDGTASVQWYLGGNLTANAQRLSIRSTNGVSDLTDSPMTIQATATTGPPDPDVSTVVSNVQELLSDGQQTATITVTLTDKFSNPIPGKPVLITSSGQNDIINQPSSLTDASGRAVGTIRSTQAGSKRISARVFEASGVELNSFATVNFAAQPAEEAALAENSNNQVTNAGTATPKAAAVKILDRNGNGVPGLPVTFNVLEGAGFLLDYQANASQEVLAKAGPLVAMTDDGGIARVIWVLGPNPGANRVEATASWMGELLDNVPVQFTATAVNPTQPYSMIYLTGRERSSWQAGEMIPEILAIKVTDVNGNAVANQSINFRVTVGNGQLSVTNAASDYQGIVQTRFTLDEAVGSNIVEAQGSLAGSPVTYSYLGVVGPPAQIVKHGSGGSSGGVGSSYTAAVRVVDLHNNPIAAAPMAFTILSGGGTIQSADNATGSDGVARATLSLPNTVGRTILRATSDSLPNFYEDVAIDVTAGLASKMAIVAITNNQHGTVGRELPRDLQVLITDQFGNPVEGQSVSWLSGGAGNTLSSTNSVSDKKGIASTKLTLGGQSLGANNVQASALTLTPANILFTVTGETNQFPLFNNEVSNKTINEGNTLTIQATATDADGELVSYRIENAPTGATFNVNGTFVWTPQHSQIGEHEVTFIATDTRDGIDVETITITVQSVNRLPVVQSFSPADTLDFSFVQKQQTVFSVSATDPDGDPVSYLWYINGTFTNIVSPQFSLNGLAYDPGTYQIQVHISDGKDTRKITWHTDIINAVELATFAAVFNEFEGVKINWNTTREINNVGFNVFRSVTETGIYAQVNADLIAASDDGKYEFVDQSVETGGRYFYKLEDIDINGNRSEHGPISIQVMAPETYDLSQNYPNPFNPTTNIRFQLPEGGRVVLQIYDVLGRKVHTLVDEDRRAGFHIITWDARNDLGLKVSTGVYYYRMVVGKGEYVESRKMLLMK